MLNIAQRSPPRKVGFKYYLLVRAAFKIVPGFPLLEGTINWFWVWVNTIPRIRNALVDAYTILALAYLSERNLEPLLKVGTGNIGGQVSQEELHMDGKSRSIFLVAGMTISVQISNGDDNTNIKISHNDRRLTYLVRVSVDQVNYA